MKAKWLILTLALSLAVGLGVIGCSDDDEDNNNPADGGNVNNEPHISFKADGVFYNLTWFPPAEYHSETHHYEIEGKVNESANHEIIELNIPDEIGTFNSNEPQTGDFQIEVEINDGEDYEAWYGLEGSFFEVHITDISPSYISGSFYATVKNASGQTRDITEGSFKVPWELYEPHHRN